jgi:hypothetical protein
VLHLLQDARLWAGLVDMQLMVVLSLLGCWSDTFEWKKEARDVD